MIIQEAKKKNHYYVECQRILDAEFCGTFNLLFNQCLSFSFFNNNYALILYYM